MTTGEQAAYAEECMSVCTNYNSVAAVLYYAPDGYAISAGPGGFGLQQGMDRLFTAIKCLFYTTSDEQAVSVTYCVPNS